jgi:hypothetical protein
MTHPQLVQRIKERVKDPKLVTSMSQTNPSTIYPRASLDDVTEAEERLGFRLPALLTRLYLEVGNGGFGPGNGLYGVEDGLTDDMCGLPLPDLYLAYIDDPAEGWPERLVPVCDWGCNSFSAIDCSKPEGEMVFFADGRERIDEGITFAQWMEDWVNGVDPRKRRQRDGKKAELPPS